MSAESPLTDSWLVETLAIASVLGTAAFALGLMATSVAIAWLRSKRGSRSGSLR